MPGAARLTDQVTCYCKCHGSPTTGNINSASSNVLINGLGAARLTDTALCKCGHTTTIVEGSPNVFVNGLALARLDDKVDSPCPVGTITSSSNNVVVN